MPRRQDGPKLTSRATYHSSDDYVADAPAENGGSAPVPMARAGGSRSLRSSPTNSVSHDAPINCGAITVLVRQLARQAAREWRANSVPPQSAPPSDISTTTQPTDGGDRDGER